MKNPLVSVVMATFNEPVSYIKESIESVLNQTYKNLELIIVDDSTRFETIETIDSYNSDNRVIIIRDKKRFGFVKALNIGLQKANGQFIARMDADDVSLLNRIATQIDFFEKNPKIDIVGSNIQIINENGEIVSYRKYFKKNFFLQLGSIFRSPVAHPTVMFRRSIIDNHFFYNENFKKSEDVDFWFRLRNNGYKFENLPHNLLSYRISGDLAFKRSKEHFSFNFKARYKNYSWKYFYIDLPSLAFTKLYAFMPKKNDFYLLRQRKQKTRLILI
ncbi:MAG: glycosyltransferase [Paludibacter sp.]